MNLKSMKKTGNRSAERKSWIERHGLTVVLILEITVLFYLAVIIH